MFFYKDLMMKKVLFGTFVLVFFVGCANKIDEYNKPADYWYGKIINKSNVDTQVGDDAYNSLRSEHIKSPLLNEATMIIAKAHIDNEEYILANYYLDEYIKRFSTDKNSVSFAKYLKIKASFLAFSEPYREQNLLLETIEDAKNYLKEHKDGKYNLYVQTILNRLYLSQYHFEKNIASLYKRVGKTKASEYYSNKIQNSYLKNVEYEAPKQTMLRKIIE
jgi:outer membrane protein assembly factor BamD